MSENRDDRKILLAIVGPTASGKSALGVRLARALPGEVISADSMQIYRGMNIGTAKASLAERHAATHHLIDIREPGNDFSAAEYQTLARRTISDILNRDKTPVIVGGTGLYIDSALYNYEYKAEEASKRANIPREKAAWKKAAREKTGMPDKASPETAAREKTRVIEGIKSAAASLWDELKEADPESAKSLHPNDIKRVSRALAYYRLHGTPISANKQAYVAPRTMYPTIWIGLNLRRDALYQIIDKRVDKMMEDGFLSEAADLFKHGLSPDSQAGQAIGYKQMLRFLRGELEFDETVSLIKRESRRYAKRQLTWFRRNKSVIWLDASIAAMTSFEDELAEMIRSLSPSEVYRRVEAPESVVSFFRAKGMLYKERIANDKT